MALVASALCVTTVACGTQRPGAAEDPTTPPPSLGPPVTIRIGFLGVTSGQGAGVGRAVSDGERLAVSQFSDTDRDVDVTIDDASTEGTQAGAAAGARRLVADGVAAVVGPQSPTEVRGAEPVLSAAGIPAITATATATDLADAGWTSFLRVVADDRQQGTATALELMTTLHVPDVAIFDGRSAEDAVRAAAAAGEVADLGGSVGMRRTVRTAAAARTAAAEMAASAIGGVYIAAPTSTELQLVTALVANSYPGPILVASDDPASTLASLGPAADGVYLISPSDDPTAAAAAASGGGGGGRPLVFDDAYRAAFGTRPPIWAAEAYDATDAVIGAVTSGCTTGAQIDAYLLGHTSAGVTATIAFGPTGNQIDPPVFVSQVLAGTSVQIAVAPPLAG